MDSNENPGVKDPKVILTVRDLEDIRSFAIKHYNDLDPRKLKMDDSQFRTYCYTMAVQGWLRSKGLLKIILD